MTVDIRIRDLTITIDVENQRAVLQSEAMFRLSGRRSVEMSVFDLYMMLKEPPPDPKPVRG